MKQLLLLLSLMLCSCLSGGAGVVRLDVEMDGGGRAASNLNSYGIVSNGSGSASITFAELPFLPVYPPFAWVGSTVILGSHDPDYVWRGTREDMIPPDAEAVARKLWTPTDMAMMGLHFESGPILPNP